MLYFIRIILIAGVAFGASLLIFIAVSPDWMPKSVADGFRIYLTSLLGCFIAETYRFRGMLRDAGVEL